VRREDYNGLKKGSDWGAYHPFLSPIRCSLGLFHTVRVPLMGENSTRIARIARIGADFFVVWELLGEDYNGLKKGSDWGAHHPFLSSIRCSLGLFHAVRVSLRGE
jgi:hypothetical protein